MVKLLEMILFIFVHIQVFAVEIKEAVGEFTASQSADNQTRIRDY
jgi:hypothetical protein